MLSSFPEPKEKKVVGFNDSRSRIIYLNIGGTFFQTFEYNLTKYDSIFKQLFLLKDYSILLDNQGRIFFDRPAHYFKLILQTLQTEETELELSEKMFEIERENLEREIEYYGLNKNLKVKIYIPPEPLGPTFYERLQDFTFNFKQNFRNFWALGIMKYIFNNKIYLINAIVGSISTLLVFFTILLFFVSVGVINNKINYLFWPFYGISLLIIASININTIYDKMNGYVDTGVYVIQSVIVLIITFSLSFLFSKVYYWYHDIPYYNWCSVNILPLIATLICLIIETFFIVEHQLRIGFSNLKYDLTLENITIFLIPYNLFWIIWGLSLYMDGIFVKKIGWILIPHIIHIILAILYTYNYSLTSNLTNMNKNIVKSFYLIVISYIYMIITCWIGFYKISVLPFTFCMCLVFKRVYEFI